jgi:hypothetical protein
MKPETMVASITAVAVTLGLFVNAVCLLFYGLRDQH